MGTHYFQIQLQVGIPQVGAAAGRLLCLETMLYAPQANGPRAPLASADVSVPFNPDGEVRLPTLHYLITNAQLLALEQRRTGDLRLELQVKGFLPQSASGFPGGSEITEYISIAESRWRQQLAGLGRTLGAEMLIPFPDDDEPRRGVADFLRNAQHLLGGNETDAAMLQVRKALETIRNTSGGCGRARRTRATAPWRSGGPSSAQRWKTRPAGPCTWTRAPKTTPTPEPRSRH
jgi:hypothetical protein